MKYKVSGGNLPVLSVLLSAGEMIECQSGGMSWMDDEIEMQTEFGGIGKMFSRAVTGESVTTNTYIAHADGEIAFASTMPGDIRAVRVSPGNPIIVQKKAWLASVGDIQRSVYFQKKLGAGFFGGEGFLMQQFSGDGMVFLEIDGSAAEFDISQGDRKIIDTGHLVMMDNTVGIDVQMVKGVKNVLFGGEGLFNTVLTGPGHIILQSMPIQSTAANLYQYMPHPNQSSGGFSFNIGS